MSTSTILGRVLIAFQSKGTLTPDDINKCADSKGNYASKHVLYLKLSGHKITTNKQGRMVIDYTYVGVDPNFDNTVKQVDRRASKMLGTAAKAKPVSAPVAAPVAAKPVKVAKPAPVKTVKADKPAKPTKTAEELAEIKEANLEKMREVAARMASLRKSSRRDEVQEELGSTGEIATSYSVDGEWDSVDGLDLTKMINAD
jgi:hypothetical protein